MRYARQTVCCVTLPNNSRLSPFMHVLPHESLPCFSTGDQEAQPLGLDPPAMVAQDWLPIMSSQHLLALQSMVATAAVAGLLLVSSL